MSEANSQDLGNVGGPESLPDARGRYGRRLTEVAGLLTALSLLGVMGLRVGVAPGVEPVPLAERHRWLGEFPALWTLTWGIWMLVSFAFLGFLLFAMWELKSHRCIRIATWIAGAAAIVSLTTRVLLSGALPLVATMEGTRRFRTIESLLWFLELVPTRILCVLAVLVFTLGLRRARLLDARASLAAWIYVLAAGALVFAGWRARFDWGLMLVLPEALMLSTWSIVVALQLNRRP